MCAFSLFLALSFIFSSLDYVILTLYEIAMIIPLSILLRQNHATTSSTLNAIVCLTVTLFFWVTHSVDSNDYCTSLWSITSAQLEDMYAIDYFLRIYFVSQCRSCCCNLIVDLLTCSLFFGFSFFLSCNLCSIFRVSTVQLTLARSEWGRCEPKRSEGAKAERDNSDHWIWQAL